MGRQPAGVVWRNVVVSRRQRRVTCIDRYQCPNGVEGYVYVFQADSKKYPVADALHWDVSDARHTETTGQMLADLDALAISRLSGGGDESHEAPASQEAYWELFFRADSLFDGQRYDESIRLYDRCFADDRFILPSQLSGVAAKMVGIGQREKALGYLQHRLTLEKDFYMAPAVTPYPELRDTFELRSRRWGYDLDQKELLEGVFERDQYDRMLWSQAVTRRPHDELRNELLARRALRTDSLNVELVSRVLGSVGFPARSQVGDMAVQAVWLVFQHSSLDLQQQFLPQMEQAVQRGDIAPLFLAMLKDRIEVREGRPQRYGTQMDASGHLCPLLDESMVNEWRQQVGLPPIAP